MWHVPLSPAPPQARPPTRSPFARYTDSDFGWNINRPRPRAGAGERLAAAGRGRRRLALGEQPLGAVAGDRGRRYAPPELRSSLLDIKPGFEDDPTRAVYNHVWVIGDSSAVGARVQAEVDELVELGAGAGGPVAERKP